MKIKINEIIFREDLYPRFEPNQQLIKKYSESIEYLPPIKIDQHKIMIDGFHRLKAHELEKKETIKVEIIQVKSEKELKRLAYKYNSNHGAQLKIDEKKVYANEMIGEMTTKELAETLSVSETTIKEWTKTTRKAQEEQRNRLVLEEYLRAWNTQKNIAEKFRIAQKTVSNILKNISKKGGFADFTKRFEENKKLYNIWNTSKGNETESFGSFPRIFMDNLLFYHTKTFDIIYDPFCGDGTTIDSCKKFFRRYYCSDMNMCIGREKDMKIRKIQDGYPEDLQKPNLVFIDPPYWKQAEGKYSDSPDDLANMELEQFYEIFGIFLNELIKRKIEKIVIVIQPTQYKNDFIFEDHIFKFYNILQEKYFIEMRYMLPYSTQQYNAQIVNKAKELKKCLILNRDLVVWSLK